MTILKKTVKYFFQYCARLTLKKYKPTIIAITGNVGKTTTRDFLYSVLSKKFFVRKSEKSFGAELGIPLTIIGAPYATHTFFQFVQNIFYAIWVLISRVHYPEWLILEIDGDKPGDIDNLVHWLPVTMLIITAIGDIPSHVESFDSDIEKFLKERKNLIDSVARDGVIFYNADDEIVSNLLTLAPVKKISCGLHRECAVCGSDFTIVSGLSDGISIPLGMTFSVSIGDVSYPITIMDSVGFHNEYASLLALSVAHELGFSIEESIVAIEKSVLLPGRMKIILGLNNSTIIDDSYNSSPIGVRQALQTLSRIHSPRKIAVLGDMLELGKYSTAEHRQLAEQLQNTASLVVCVGIRSQIIIEELISLGFPASHIFQMDTSVQAGVYLKDILEPGDVVLVKGSQTMRMERAVEEIMLHPEEKAKLLVRQEPEWLLRK